MRRKSQRNEGPENPAPDRTARLEAALRANLKRRKEQARARLGRRSQEHAESVTGDNKSSENSGTGPRT
jgi:hypothetical protein